MDLDSHPKTEPDLLFSFVGAIRSHRCRAPILGLRHPDSVVEDTQGFVFYDPDAADYRKRREHFVDTLVRSRFVLCPRGRGTSSIRLYETLAAGRVPVITGRPVGAPPGPRWPEFSLRVPEDQVARLPALLEQTSVRWPEMSARAAESSPSGSPRMSPSTGSCRPAPVWRTVWRVARMRALPWSEGASFASASRPQRLDREPGRSTLFVRLALVGGREPRRKGGGDPGPAGQATRHPKACE